MDKNKKKHHQVRHTHRDTLVSQLDLLDFIKSKISNPILKDNEVKNLMILSADSLLSRGATFKFTFPWTSKDGTRSAVLNLGNIHTVLLQMEEYATKEEVEIPIYGEVYRIKTADLWKRLYQSLKLIFPSSLAEAHARSKERVEREFNTAHEFDVNEEV